MRPMRDHSSRRPEGQPRQETRRWRPHSCQGHRCRLNATSRSATPITWARCSPTPSRFQPPSRSTSSSPTFESGGTHLNISGRRDDQIRPEPRQRAEVHGVVVRRHRPEDLRRDELRIPGQARRRTLRSREKLGRVHPRRHPLKPTPQGAGGGPGKIMETVDFDG